MDINEDVSALLMALDAKRVSCGMSYQSVADACNVSKPTIYRTLTGVTEPSMQLLQAIAAAVQYKPVAPVVLPEECTQEAYTAYLKELLQRQREDNDRHIRQLQAHYNMLHRQDRRTIVVLGAILGMLVAAFILWLIIDVTHPNIGWFQR